MARTLRCPGLHGPVEIARDPAGTPIIRAHSYEDAMFGLGFLHVSDRPLQLTLQLAAVDGQLSERIADRPELRALDRAIQRMGLPRQARREVGQLSALARVRVAAYAAGVNTARAQLRRPPEMLLLRAELPVYELHHALGLLYLMAYAGLADGQRLCERFVVEALQRGVPEAGLRALFAPHLDGMDAALLRGVRLAASVLHDVAAPVPALPRAAASNNWVVAPSRSASGAALLANDPHLEVNRLPQLMYEAQIWLREEEWAHGATVPGLPGFPFGRNAQLAWGLTYGTADACDYFVERCDGRGNHFRDGAWQPLHVRRELVAGEEAVTVWETDHGVVEGPAGVEAGDYLAWAWSAWGRAAESLDGFMRMSLARSVAEARAAVASVALPALNFVFADAAGEVGYQYAGAIPKRRPGWSGLYPVAGWEPENDWRGMVPAAELPAAHPHQMATGVYATANDRPDRAGGPSLSTIPQPSYRRDRILELLGGERLLGIADLAHVQADVVSLQARRLLPVLLPHVPDGAVRRALEAWDCRYDAAAREPTLFENLYEEVLRSVFCDGPWGQWLGRVLHETSLLVLLFGNFDDILVQEDSTWLPRARRAEVLGRACARGAAQPAPPWGERHALVMRHLVFGGKLGARLRLDRGPIPWDGGRATVKQASLFFDGGRLTSFAPCYHFVTALGGQASWTNTPAGPSERPWSRFYASDLERWLYGELRELRPDGPAEDELLLVP